MIERFLKTEVETKALMYSIPTEIYRKYKIWFYNHEECIVEA